jgi:hypothetical protein
MNRSFDYGFWPLVVINSAIFIIFAFSFTKPKTGRDWRSLGAFSAFVVGVCSTRLNRRVRWPRTVHMPGCVTLSTRPSSWSWSDFYFSGRRS